MSASPYRLLGACVVSLVVASPCLAQPQPQPQRPAGAVTRPIPGVQHPELDKAWDAYDAIVTKSVDGIRAAISKQFDAATEKGDLTTALKWEAALAAFKESGAIPYQPEIAAEMREVVSQLKIAKEKLVAAYDAVVITLTKDKNLAAARAAQGESIELSKRKVVQKPKAKDPQIRVTTFDLSKPAAMKVTGRVNLKAGGLEFPGTGGWSFADLTSTCKSPLKVTFKVKAFPDKTMDIMPGIFASLGVNNYSSAGVHLHWGTSNNQNTRLYVFGNKLELRHNPIVAEKDNTVVMEVDADRKLTVTINNIVIHQEVLPDHYVLTGCVRCGGGFGHLLYRSVEVETEVS